MDRHYIWSQNQLTMKKFFLIAFAVTGLSLCISAQNKTWRSNVGLIAGTSQYNGEWGNDFYSLGTVNPFGGFSFNQYLIPRLRLNFSVLSGGWGYERNDSVSFDVKHIQLGTSLGILLRKKELPVWSPYISVGLALNSFSSYTIEDGIVLHDTNSDDFRNQQQEVEKLKLAFPVSAGIQFRLNDRMFLDVKETLLSSGLELWDNSGDGNADMMLMHTIGLSFGINEWKDSDQDGVGDKDDKCPATPGIAVVDEYGCPVDSDLDGLADFEDQCPDVAGVISGRGCPDRDGDGFTDDTEKCPDVAGLSQLTGCPDGDGDGITDLEDECPAEKGIAGMKGCPDTDGDGIRDKDDDCPKVKGAAKFKGCPDKDGDGIQDKEDNCPDVAGMAANKGCPEVKEEVKELFRQALTGVKFETAKDVIKAESFVILDNVVKVMMENPAYRLKIDGHTDNVGDPSKNLDLSNRRAMSVSQYLVQHGIQASRLTATGYGDQKPVADNSTKAGRELNRRVEFTVEF